MAGGRPTTYEPQNAEVARKPAWKAARNPAAAMRRGAGRDPVIGKALAGTAVRQASWRGPAGGSPAQVKE